MKQLLSIIVLLFMAAAARAQEVKATIGIVYPAPFYRDYQPVPGMIASAGVQMEEGRYLLYGFIIEAHALKTALSDDSRMVLGAPLASLAFQVNYRYPIGNSYLYAGARGGFCLSKVRQHNNLAGYRSGAGIIAGVQLGGVLRVTRRLGICLETTPRYYRMNWDTKMASGLEKGEIIAVPVLAGLNISF